MLASVVISTYNRAEALPATLSALADQDVAAEEYEVLVVDDGSTDTTAEVLAATSVPYRLRAFRLDVNSGVSAGRNIGLRNAEGRYIIMISDDLIVPPAFISAHVSTLMRFPDCWVVGGFKQLESLTLTPFGRFLDRLETQFEAARLGTQIADGIYEMHVPTARNLSLPSTDIGRVGLFDERFRVTCEDQDLATRAADCGIKFIYNADVECVHNDQASDLARYCRFQERGAADTARLCDKYPELHSDARLLRHNVYITRRDPFSLAFRKLVKRLLALSASIKLVATTVAVAEKADVPLRWLDRGYRLLIGLHIFRGFRAGLRDLGGRRSALMSFLAASPAMPCREHHRQMAHQPPADSID